MGSLHLKMKHLFMLLLLVSINVQAQSVEILAHRGFRGLHTENTLEAFKNALHHTYFLEMDVMISKDLKVVVTHDPLLHDKLYVNNQNKDLGVYDKRIYNLNYTDIEKYALGLKKSKGFEKQQSFVSKVPLLETVLQETQVYAATNKLREPHFFIETKITDQTDGANHPEPKVVVELLIDVLNKHVKPSQVIIQSFDPRTLSYLSKHYPEFKTCLLDKKKQLLSVYLKELDFKPDYFSPSFKQISSELIEESKKFKIPLIGGNSNSRQEIDKMYELGIHQIISDYPYAELP